MTYEFTLTDSDGEPHNYTITKPHPPIARGGSEVSGLRLINRLARAAGAPISRLLDTNLGSLIQFVMEQRDSGEDVTLGAILNRFDVQDLDDVDLQIPDAFDAFCETLEHIDVAETLPQVLYHTSRDGHPLKDPKQFNRAYEQNYYELARAAWEVVRYNGFFGSLATQAAERSDE